MNIFKNIIDKVVDAFSSSKEFKINDYDETNYDDKIVPYNEILESKNGILIALLSKIAKSDGVISVNESNYISKQIDSFQIKEEIRHIYSKEIINQEKDNTSNIEELCKKFLVSNKNESKIFIKNLVGITKVDNKFDKNQYKMLSDIMTFINLPEDNIKEFQIELLEKPNEECKKLYQKLYILKLEKEDIKGKIEEIEYKAFKNYGEIKLELLSLKKDLSKEFLEEYNNYLEFYNKYKNYTKKFDESLTNYKAYIDFHRLNMLTQMINNYKHDISLLQEEIKELKRNESYQMSLNFMTVNQYFNSERELLKTELESIQNKKQNKSKIIVVTEDIELKKLKQKLKRLEIKFQQLIEEKTEYLNDIEEFNTQYNLHLGELIRTILNLKKEILYKKTIKNQKLKEQYKTNKNICEETKQTIDELQNTIVELEDILENIDESNENYDEINSAYNEIKEELEKLEDELLIQEEKLEKTEEELKENEIFEEEYEEAKATYEQFDDEYEHIKDTQKDIIKLDEEQQKELKILFKKAAKLCHPDIVADELKEKALEIMQSLNDAYSKKDITLIKKILLSLENGTTFKTVSSDIEDKELLANKIKEFKQNISDLKDEIEHIKLDDTFTTITQLDNWDEYFEELKNELTEQKITLEKEAMEVLEEKEEIEEWIQKLWNWADENNIPNGKLSRQKEKLLSITTIDFTGLKLKNICKEIFNLKNVTTFSLWDNDISFLPNEIVSFTNLKKLNLRGNPNLTITPFQQEWINNLRKESVVFIDEVRLSDDKYEMVSEKLQVEQSIEEIINLVLKDFKNEHKIDLSTNYQIMLRIKDEAKKTANNLMNNTEAKFVLNYITYINNKPVNIEKTLIKEKFGFINIVNDKTVKNEHKPSYPQKDKDNKVVSENSSYSKHIQSIENPNFEKIRRYCNNLLNDNQADDMQEYLANNGKMYKAIIYDALEQFISKLDGEKISLVDWGCNQGIGSMLVFDYIKEKQLDIIVNQIILVDDNTTAISRAISQLEALKQNDIEVITIQSDDIDELEKLKNIKNDIILNLIVNDKFPVNYLNIDYEVFKNAYFMCVSNTNKAFVDDMYKNISDFSSVENISIRDSKIGKFEKFERIFKI